MFQNIFQTLTIPHPLEKKKKKTTRENGLGKEEGKGGERKQEHQLSMGRVTKGHGVVPWVAVNLRFTLARESCNYFHVWEGNRYTKIRSLYWDAYTCQLKMLSPPLRFFYYLLFKHYINKLEKYKIWELLSIYIYIKVLLNLSLTFSLSLIRMKSGREVNQDVNFMMAKKINKNI